MSINKRKGFGLSLFLVLLVLSCMTVLGFQIYDMITKPVSDEDVSSNEISKQNGKSFNALLIGVDVGGENTDTIMLAHFDKEDKRISLLSIPRDTKVEVDGKHRKINSLYRKGGIDLLLSKIKEMTEIDINYYAIIKPGMLAQIVDELGGVEFEVERDMHYSDPYQDLYIDLKKGKQTLDGDKAEQLCRFRMYMMGDLTRTETQQKFMKALLDQKLNMENIGKADEIYNILSDNIISNVSLNDIMSNKFVFGILKNNGQIETLEVPGNYNDLEKEKVSYYLIENEALTELKTLCADKFDGAFENGK